MLTPLRPQQSNIRASDLLLPYLDVIRNNSANPRFWDHLISGKARRREDSETRGNRGHPLFVNRYSLFAWIN
jgi:hypothetical protein